MKKSNRINSLEELVKSHGLELVDVSGEKDSQPFFIIGKGDFFEEEVKIWQEDIEKGVGE